MKCGPVQFGEQVWFDDDGAPEPAAKIGAQAARSFWAHFVDLRNSQFSSKLTTDIVPVRRKVGPLTDHLVSPTSRS